MYASFVYITSVLLSSALAATLITVPTEVRPAPNIQHPSSPTQFPYFVSLRLPYVDPPHIFSGTILNKNWILTAARGLPDDSDRDDYLWKYYAVVGSGDAASEGTRYEISYFVRHPQFDNVTLANNIALLKTVRTIRMNERVQPIQLSAEVDIRDGDAGTVVGYPEVSVSRCAIDRKSKCLVAFQLNYFQRSRTNEFRYVNVTTMQNENCRKRLRHDEQLYVLPDTFCAEGLENDVNLNEYSDLGAALVCSKMSKAIGMASVILNQNDGLKQAQHPNIYLKIAPYTQWINDTMADD